MVLQPVEEQCRVSELGIGARSLWSTVIVEAEVAGGRVVEADLEGCTLAEADLEGDIQVVEAEGRILVEVDLEEGIPVGAG